VVSCGVREREVGEEREEGDVDFHSERDREREREREREGREREGDRFMPASSSSSQLNATPSIHSFPTTCI
jgi:hypothetical protein